MQRKLPPSEKVWLRVPEAAAVMDLGINRVYALANAGQLPHRRVGSTIHIHREVAETWTPDGDACVTTPVRLPARKRV